jgi:hypothetical protein
MIATAIFIGLLSAIFFVIRFIKRKKTD